MKNIILILFLTACSFFFLNHSSFAQLRDNNDIRFRTYTMKDGLVYDDVMQMNEDSNGFLWIATNHGVSRFDGVSFKNFLHDAKSPNSIPDNFAYGVAVDKQDRVWLALKSTLCFYDQRADSFIVIRYNQKPVKCQTIAYDKKRNAVVGISNGQGYFVVDCKTFQCRYYEFESEKSSDPNAIGYCYIDTKDRLWVPFARKGYYTINLANHRQTYFSEIIWPMCFFEDVQGNNWCGTWQGGFRKVLVNPKGHVHNIYGDDFVKYAGGSWNFISFSITENTKLWGDSILLVATETGGLRLFNKNENRFTKATFRDPYLKEGAPTNNYNYVWTSRNGITWLGSWHGLLKINKKEQQFTTSVFPFFNLITSYGLIVGLADDPADNKYRWFITDGSGILKTEKQTGKIVKKAFFYHNDTDTTQSTGEDKNFNWRWSSISLIDKEKTVWISGNYGLIKISKRGIDTLPFINAKKENVIAYYMHDEDSVLYVGSQAGICRFVKATSKYRFIAPQWPNHAGTPGVKQVKPITENLLAVCSRFGAAVFNKKDETFRYLKWHIPSVDSNDQMVCRAVEVIGDNIYFGTHSGLVKYNIKTNNFEIIGQEEGIDKLYDNTLKADSKGNLWIITNHGLFKYIPVSGKFEKFTTGDGIYHFSHDLISFFEHDKKYYLGFRGAYTAFDPLMVNQNTKLVTPILTDIFVKGKRINYFNDTAFQIKLTYLENDISFSFAAPDFTNADKIQYAVKLEGFDKDWKYIGTAQTVNYNNLLPGTYQLKLKAANSSGLWGREKIASLFTIQPAWWQRIWFWPLIILLFIGLIALAAVLRVKQIRKREEQKTMVATQLAELEMKALRSQMNPHFIFNSLNSIQKYIWENKKENASEYLSDFSKLIRMILEASGQKVISLSKEIDILRAYIALEHRRSSNKFSYHIFVDEDLQAEMVQIPPLLLQPYIENAIWHGLLQKAGHGTLNLRFEQKGEYVLCTIEDDGIGREKALKIKAAKSGMHKSVALGITKERIQLIRHHGRSASVEIIDKINEEGYAEGTKVILKIPV